MASYVFRAYLFLLDRLALLLARFAIVTRPFIIATRALTITGPLIVTGSQSIVHCC